MTKDSRSNREESLASDGDAMNDEWDASDEQLLERVVAHYRHAFQTSQRPAAWLGDRGVDLDTAERFEIGWSDRTLGLGLPSPDRAAGRQLRGRLQALGVLRSTGHEQFRGCVVIPVRDRDGRLVQLCGLRLDRPQRRADRPSTPLDEVLWLPEPASTIFNPRALGHGEVIFAGNVLDALVWWTAGIHHVIAAAGPEISHGDLAEQMQAARVHRALLAMTRTATGDIDARALADELSTVGVECFRVVFPHDCGVVELAREGDDLGEVLAERLREATWLAGPAADSAGEPPSDTGPLLASPVPPSPRADGVDVEGGELRLTTEGRCWRVRGLDRVPAGATGSLKLNVLVRDVADERFFVDVVDLYAARAAKRSSPPPLPSSTPARRCCAASWAGFWWRARTAWPNSPEADRRRAHRCCRRRRRRRRSSCCATRR